MRLGNKYLEDLNEEILLQVANNDPDVSGLTITSNNWIEGSGSLIGDSKFLQKIFVKEIFWGEHNWLYELCHRLSRNQSIELFKLWLYGCNPELDIFHIIPLF